MITVGFKRLTDDAILPVRAHYSDSGFDLFANENLIIEPGETIVVKTGIAINLPDGYEAQVRPRSGISSKTKLRVQLGTIDNSYTGEIGIIVDNTENHDESLQDEFHDDTLKDISERLINAWDYLDAFDDFHNVNSYLIKKGDKLAQLVIQKLPQVHAYEVDKLPDTERGTNGFGSTGSKVGEKDD
ncbi:dUTP diphosphatase [Ornithinibacillus sp. 4-3]|uniref:dUTP diphosphatase n=1 Tax=Ornithinibacillus sp. 4-3 TaxID=3231488 RepID=A0AB39HMA6_9BACI